MKTLSPIRPLLACLAFLVSKAADFPLPILTSSQLAVIDSGTGDGPHLTFELSSIKQPIQSAEFYRVFTEIRTTSSGFPVRSSPTRIDFAAKAVIGPASKDYLDDGGANWIGFQTFDESREQPFADWQYFDKGGSLPATSFAKSLRTKTSFFIGYRFTAEDGSHYGWLQFTRPDTHFLTLFQLTAQDWNPLPGEPIGAGLPPAIPLTPQVTAEGLLQLAWPAAVAGWILEFSAALGPGEKWLAVPDVAGSEVTLVPPETAGFFRLRRP